ncbi:MAG: hypothetical protein WDN46_20480 [Methylocella sp.]
MTIQYWIVDIYDALRTEPRLEAQTLEFGAALKVVATAKQRGDNERIKVKAPLDADWSEVEQLLALGADVTSGPS